jgi:flagellar biosynthesis protein FliR
MFSERCYLQCWLTEKKLSVPLCYLPVFIITVVYITFGFLGTWLGFQKGPGSVSFVYIREKVTLNFSGGIISFIIILPFPSIHLSHYYFHLLHFSFHKRSSELIYIFLLQMYHSVVFSTATCVIMQILHISSAAV